jgi:hypothetical protein
VWPDIPFVMNAGRGQTSTAIGLHVCPTCDSHLVQPTCWEQTSKEGQWRIWRRCPECEWHTDGVHGEPEIDDFDEQLDSGTRELADGLRSLERANMEHVVETFAAALAADLIGPDDFRR